MTPKQKISFLKKKGLNHGDMVNFRVENQISGLWCGPTQAKLVLEGKEAPYLEAGGPKITINEGYDAYLHTIEKVCEPMWFERLSTNSRPWFE
jgi:hypothetical protein